MAIASDAHSMSPGMMPAANRRPIETWPTVPYRMKPMPGGMIGAMSEPYDSTPAAYPLENPRFSICRPRMRAFMLASAIADPVSPLISVYSAIEVWASPPCILPVSTVASLSRLWVMPELLRKLPARMNSGTANSAKFWVSVTVSWIGMVGGSSGCCRKNSAPEMPIANATGMPSSSSTVNAIRTISIGVARSALFSFAHVLFGKQVPTFPEHALNDVHGPALGVLSAQLGAHLEGGGDQQQQCPDGQAHGHPGVADLRDALEAAGPADP